jgi:GNAT superfamily N-acetyltransferase
MTSPTLRLATLDDAPTIVRHRRAMFDAMGFTNTAELDEMDARFAGWVRRKMEQGDYRHWFVVDEAGQIIAGAGVWLMDWPPHGTDPRGPRANILNVYTEPEHRCQGLARGLTQVVLDWCRERGIRAVILHASKEGRPMYESMGFKPTNEMRLNLP